MKIRVANGSVGVRRQQTQPEMIQEAIQYWEERRGTASPLMPLTVVIRSHHGLGDHPDILLRDDSDNLYLERCPRSLTDENGEEVLFIEADPMLNSAPLTAIREGQLTPVSVKEALAWYVEASGWMSDYEGDPQELCRIAVSRLIS